MKTKTKELKDLTLKEFEDYQEMLKEEVIDTYSILQLFGYDTDKMTIPEMSPIENKIAVMTLKPVGTKLHYKVGNQRFKAHLNMTSISASQFIDLQTYLKDFKLQEVLSVFLIPMKKTWYGTWKSQKYNTGYDIAKIQELLYNEFTIGEANELSNAFFLQSQSLLKVMKDYLAKKEMKMKLKLIKTQLKEN